MLAEYIKAISLLSIDSKQRLIKENHDLKSALKQNSFSDVTHICDVGGGTGHLLSNLLMKYPHLKGTVVD